MKQYIITVNIYDSNGGSFRYSMTPKFTTGMFYYGRNERQDFIDKWEYFLREDMYYDTVRCFYIDFDSVSIIEITDRLEEIKNNI